MSTITTHILDTAKGCPAAGVRVILYRLPGAVIGEAVNPGSGFSGAEGDEMEVASGTTDKKGRISEWPVVEKGIYKMRFEIGGYFAGQSVATLYPFVEVHFGLTTDGHYHIPLLISPFGYSTYRGA